MKLTPLLAIAAAAALTASPGLAQKSGKAPTAKPAGTKKVTRGHSTAASRKYATAPGFSPGHRGPGVGPTGGPTEPGRAGGNAGSGAVSTTPGAGPTG